MARQFLDNGLKLAPETMLSFYDEDPSADIREALPKLTVPVLAMHGEDDQLIPFAAAEYIVEHAPDAALSPFPGKGHLPIFTATAAFCAELRRFVGEEAPHV